MTDVILINPRGEEDLPPGENEKAPVPLGLLAIGSYLKQQGYVVHLVDARLYKDEHVYERLAHLLANLKVNNMGLSVMTAQIPHALRLSQFIRGIDPQVPIVWGGVHGTLFPIQTSKHPLVDFVICGRGEVPYLELVKRLAENNHNYDGIEGVAIDGKVNYRKSVKDLDVNQLPSMDYDLLDLPYYIGPSLHFLLSPAAPVRALEVLSSRGCPWSCTFCINRVTRNYWRGLTPTRFLDEMEHLVDKYQLDAVRFLDEDFFVNKKRAREIVRGILERHIKITWAANARANYFNDNYIDQSFAQMLRASGMRAVAMGAESGSDRVLKFLKKGITTKDLLHSAQVCQDAGLIPRYAWMVGLPGETRAEMLASIELMRRIIERCPQAIHSGMFIFRPYPGGELYEQCRELGLEEPSSLEEWATMMGVSDQSIGFYSLDRLPWIRDKEFVKFLSDYYSSVATPLRIAVKRGLRSLVVAVVMKLALLNWDRPLLRHPLMNGYQLMRDAYHKCGTTYVEGRWID